MQLAQKVCAPPNPLGGGHYLIDILSLVDPWELENNSCPPGPMRVRKQFLSTWWDAIKSMPGWTWMKFQLGEWMMNICNKVKWGVLEELECKCKRKMRSFSPNLVNMSGIGRQGKQENNTEKLTVNQIFDRDWLGLKVECSTLSWLTIAVIQDLSYVSRIWYHVSFISFLWNWSAQSSATLFRVMLPFPESVIYLFTINCLQWNHISRTSKVSWQF